MVLRHADAGADEALVLQRRHQPLDGFFQVADLIGRGPQIVEIAVVVVVGGADPGFVLVRHDEDLPPVHRLGDDGELVRRFS